MIHSTVAQSKGLQGTINYLFQDKDSKGVKREGIDLVRGDFNSMLAREKDMDGNTVLHTTLDFTANENKDLSAQDKEDMLDSFIEQLSIGLPSPERLTYAVVEHDKDTPKAHYHIVALREDNETQKKYEPWVVARGDVARFHAWNDVMTDKFNLENPDDVPKITSPMGKTKRRSKDNQNISDNINRDIERGFKSNDINSRDDVIELLENKYKMKITRKNKHSISFRREGMKQAIKLDSFACSVKFTNRDAALEYQSHRKERPDPKLAIEKLHILENKMKSYHKNRYDIVGTKHDYHKNIDNHLLKNFIDSMDKDSVVDKLKDRIDSDSGIGNETTLEARVENVSFMDAINASKTYNIDNILDDETLIKVSAFIEKHSEFIEKYDNYMEHRLDNIDSFEEYEVSEQELKQDYLYIGMYNEVKAARTNVIEQEAKRETNNKGVNIKESVSGGSNGSGIGSVGGDIGKKMVALYAKMANEMQTIQRERDHTLKQESQGFENFNRKMNAPAPRPSPSKGKNGKRQKRKK